MTRDDIRAKFRAAEAMFRKYKFNTSPVYLEFLQGKREMTCTAWANPTRNVKGWKGPCYLITDIHHETFDDLMNKTPWEKYGYGKDPRCENCMMHSGYETTAAAGRQRPAGRHPQDDQVAVHLIDPAPAVRFGVSIDGPIAHETRRPRWPRSRPGRRRHRRGPADRGRLPARQPDEGPEVLGARAHGHRGGARRQDRGRRRSRASGRRAARRGPSSCSPATARAGSSRPGSPAASTPRSRVTTWSSPTRSSTRTGTGSTSTRSVSDLARRPCGPAAGCSRSTGDRPAGREGRAPTGAPGRPRRHGDLGRGRAGRERSVRFLVGPGHQRRAAAELPPEVAWLLTHSGSYRVGAALRAIWHRPSALKDFWTLHAQALESADRLASCIRRLIDTLPGAFGHPPSP